MTCSFLASFRRLVLCSSLCGGMQTSNTISSFLPHSLVAMHHLQRSLFCHAALQMLCLPAAAAPLLCALMQSLYFFAFSDSPAGPSGHSTS